MKSYKTKGAMLAMAAACAAAMTLGAATPASFREYIVCSGSEYIDTGVKPDKTTRVEMTFATDDTAHDKMLFGVRNNGYAFLCWVGTTAGVNFNPAIGSSGNMGNKAGNTAGAKATVDMSANGLYVNGTTLYAASSFSSYVNNSASTAPLMLFGMKTGGNIEARKYYGKCYGARIWHGGELVRCYVPCVDSDGVACMYDAVGGQCVYSATSSQLTASDALDEDSYRVVNGVVQCKVRLHGVVSTISADGGAASAGTQMWVAHGAAATFVAVPVDGASFAQWEGDADSLAAITSGSVTSPTISATVKYPLDLQAVSRLGILVVSSDTTLHESVTCGGIRFTGGYSLSADEGVKVTIQDFGAGIEVQSGSASVSCPVDFGEVASSAEQPIIIPKSATLNQTGPWGGKADLRFVGAGTLKLRGDNTFDGNLYLTNGLVDVYSDNAFGSTVGATSYDYDNNGWHMIFHGVTTPENFTVRSIDKSNIVKFQGARNVFLGTIKGSTNERWSIDDNTTVVFSNKVDGIGCWVMSVPATSKVEFFDNTTHGNVFYFGGAGPIYWYAPFKQNTSDTSVGFRTVGNTHYLCCTNATSYKNDTGWGNPQTPAVIDLCGNDQRAKWLQSGFADTVVRSATPAVLHILNATASITNTYAGTFQGKVNVSVEGPRGLILTGAHTSLGHLAMTNNARVQITSGGWAGTNVFLGGGAELTVAGTPFIADAVLDVETASGRTKYVLPAGVVQQVKRLVVDGEEMPAGVYVADEGATISGTPVGFISGQGAINVLGSGGVASDGVWDGGAGDSDLDYLTPENWEGDVVPEHDLGLVNVTFATGTATNLTIGSAVAANGAVFTGDRHFRMDKTSGSAVFGVAGGGLAFAESDAARTNVFAVPFRINASQTWNVGLNRTAVFDEPVTSAGDGSVTVQGGGEVCFNAANTYTGALRLDAGTMRFATPAAFGGAGASFTVNASVLNGATAWFPKGEISVPIAMDQSASYPAIEFPEGETVVLNGELRLSGNAGEGCRLHLRNGSELVLSGGVRGQGYLRVNKHPAQTGPARIVVTNTPTSHYDFAGDTAGVVLYTPLTEFVLAVTNCLPGRLNVLQKKYFTVSGGWARCAVTNALQCEATLGPVLRMTPSSDGTGVFDLDGYDQEVWRVEGGYNASQKTVVKSADPAVMSVVGSIGTYVTDQETNCGADFQGLVTLRRAGSGTTTLRGISSTAGRLVVESGKVEFAGVGAMTNLSEVAVSGGELAIDTAARIGAGADFRLSGGTVKISSGVEQHCKWMYVPKVGGTSPWRRARCGRYTSAACEYISGGGAIVVDGDGSGMTVIFK